MSLKATFLNVWYFVNLIPRVLAHPALKALREYRLNVRCSPSVPDFELNATFRMDRY
jgi:hypothetical protein